MPGDRKRAAGAPLALIAIGLLLILGAGGWYAYALLNPTQTPVPTPLVEQNQGEIPRVSLQDAKAAYALGSAVFVDVRSADAYAQSHVTGALSIPLAELPDRTNELDPSAWIITYCT